jgi:ABC-2 type transport system ATP-binding protein
MDNTNTIIKVSNVKKYFGNVHALDGVSLNVERGTILGLLGPNGAGKTTLVRTLTTLLAPDSGEITIHGIDLIKNPDVVRNYIGLAGQYAAVDENLTGRENLHLVGKLYHLTNKEIKERSEKLLEQFSLTDAADRVSKTYSGGMRRRLDLAASLVGQPEILFLDEPTTGLDPRSRAELWEVIEQLVKDGMTILLTTQYLEEADYLANRIVVIDKGHVIAEGTSAELKAQIGTGVLEIHLAKKSDQDRVLELLANLSEAKPTVDEVSGYITIPNAGGAQALIEAVRILDSEGIELSDIELRKPTLDEVFITLTGTSNKDASTLIESNN